MADLKNVVEHLQIIRTWAELDEMMGRGMEPKCCLRIAEWVDEALDALKEQEPRVMTLEELKPVKPHRCILSRLGSDVMECYECGSCGKALQPCDKYCRHCGRAVKWDG